MASKWRRAAAEFIVVVLGVVVGLAADGWRQDLADRRDEAMVLERLTADLLADSAQLAFGVERLNAKRAGLTRLIVLEHVTVSTAADVANDVAAASSYAWNAPSANSTTFDELVSTGRLALIREPSVRDGLSSYYTEYASIISTIDRRRTRFGPISYELVRRREYVGGSGDGGTDFQAAQLSEREIARLIEPGIVEELRVVSTAELSATGWSLSRLESFQGRTADLLERLRNYSN